MSEHRQQLQTEPEITGEVRLEPEMAAALQQEFAHLPASLTGNEINHRVLEVLVSGRELTSWWEQTALRVKWIALPMLAGFVLFSAALTGFTAYVQAQQPALFTASGITPPLPAFAPLPEPLPKGTTYHKSAPKPVLSKEKKR